MESTDMGESQRKAQLTRLAVRFQPVDLNTDDAEGEEADSRQRPRRDGRKVDKNNQIRQLAHLFYLKGSREGVRISVIVDSHNHSYIQKSAPSLSHEYSLQSTLRHPNIVRAFSYVSRSDADYILMEHCVNGDLLDRLKSKGGLSEKTARKVMAELIAALECCHEQGIAHLDIKPENIYFDLNFTSKLGDFGHSRKADFGLVLDPQLGTQGYMAPEMHEDKEYDGFRADVFSAGIVLFMLLTAHRPFARAHSSDSSYRLLQSDPSRFWQLHSEKLSPSTHRVPSFPQAFTELATAMMRDKPEQRLSLEEVKRQEWMQGPHASRGEVKEELWE